jgi:glutaconate CoA-transferase subunit B
MGGCGISGRSQIDKYGNINTTAIGDYEKPKSRLPGSGREPHRSAGQKGSHYCASQHAQPGGKSGLHHNAGYLDGPGARERWGLPTDTGPQVIITNKAVLRFDATTKEAYLESFHPGASVDEVVKLTPLGPQGER